MKKNILSFIKNTYTKSFVLGLALAFIIAFSVQSVVASSQTLKFIPEQSGLINKIGSLTVGSNDTEPWILSMDEGEECMNSKAGIEDQTCLAVNGTGAFSKLMVLDIPAFVAFPNSDGTTNSLFLNNDGNSSTISGLPSGLILENTGGDDSIMATGLQRNDDSGVFTPINTTDMRGLCADNAGVFYPCEISAPVETYHWDEGAWGECSVADESVCDGSWDTTTGGGSGSCSGTYQTTGNGVCNGGAYYGSGGASGIEGYCEQDALTEFECDYLGSECNWLAGSSSSNSCSGLSQQSCITDQQYAGCQWNNGTTATTTTTQCSAINPATENACTSQNDGSSCTWTDAGTSVATRDIVCKNSANETVIDQFCIDNVGAKEPTSSDDSDLSGGNFCEVPVNAVCGNSVTSNQCSTGTYNASPADSATHYLWSCLGSNGGSDVTNCQEVIPANPINGSCNNTVNNGCYSGVLNDTTDTSINYLWSCTGSNGGTNDSCSKAKTSAGGCNYPTPYNYSNSNGLNDGVGHGNVYCNGGCGECTGGGYVCSSGVWINNPESFYCDSFLPGTMVSMADGTMRDVIDVKLGDKVKTSGGIGTITKQYTYETDADVYRMNTDEYFVTASHPFMTTDGWRSFDPESTRRKVPSIETNLLEIGDVLIKEDGTYEVLTNNDFIKGPNMVYNFSVDGTHDFYANGYWVHNK